MDISAPLAGAVHLGRMAAFDIFEFFLSERQNRGMSFECPSSRQETAMAERSRKCRSTAGLCATQRGADELRRRFANSSPMNEGNFPVRKASRSTENAERFSLRESLIRFPCWAPSEPVGNGAEWLEKIESAPENGMVSEASKPQHLVYGRAAHRALRRNSLGPPPMARRPQFTNSKRRKADGKFTA